MWIGSWLVSSGSVDERIALAVLFAAVWLRECRLDPETWFDLVRVSTSRLRCFLCRSAANNGPQV